jgi:hypothetical protein
VDGHLPDCLVDGHAGVVDKIVDASSGGEDLLGDPLAVVRLPDVALVDGHREPLGGELACQVVGCRPVGAVPQGDMDAVPGEGFADRRADAAGPAGHDGDTRTGHRPPPV